MHKLDDQLEQAQLLIHRIQHRFSHSTAADRRDCEKLLSLSEQISYAYGQAMAHVCLAQHTQMENPDAFLFHLNRAKEIAEHQDYSDIRMECLKQEGLRCVKLHDEMMALAFYLKGVKLATEMKDMKARVDFYRCIGKIFNENGAYFDAEQYYQKALEALKQGWFEDAALTRKAILIDLMALSCFQNNLTKAKQYRKEYEGVSCNDKALRLLFLASDLRISLLEQKQEELQQQIQQLKTKLSKSEEDAVALQPVYWQLMEVLLLMKQREDAAWCLARIDLLYGAANVELPIQKLHIRFAEVFGGEEAALYEKFYEAARKGESTSKSFTAESFQSMIALYETAKEQNRMMQECEDLQTEADKDELTKIYNRRYYSKLISKLLQDDRVSSLGCMMIDVDFFKEYNDYYGHPQGDSVLKEVADLLTQNLPENAYAARYGGDEFSCLFADAKDQEMASFVQKVQQGLAEKQIPHEKSTLNSMLTLSFGIYNTLDLHNCVESDLIEKADQALYQSKKNGRNTYTFYTQRRQQ